MEKWHVYFISLRIRFKVVTFVYFIQNRYKTTKPQKNFTNQTNNWNKNNPQVKITAPRTIAGFRLNGADGSLFTSKCVQPEICDLQHPPTVDYTIWWFQVSMWFDFRGRVKIQHSLKQSRINPYQKERQLNGWKTGETEAMHSCPCPNCNFILFRKQVFS